MSGYNCDYVRRHYDVPAEIGRQVKPHSCLAFCISSGGLYANRFSLNR